MLQTKISVIIPVYNTCQYLSRCIDSVLSQTYKDFEIILIDDGSVDGSQLICDEYAEEHINIKVIHQRNSGVSAARNAGIDASHGEYITFIDSDDAVHPTFLKVLLDDLEQFSGDIASSYRILLYDETALNAQMHREYHAVSTPKTMDKGKAVQALLTGSISPSSCLRLYRRSVVADTRFPIGRKSNEDKFFLFECLLAAKITVWRDDPLYLVFKHDDSSSGRANPFNHDTIDLARMITSRINDEMPELLVDAKKNELKTMLLALHDVMNKTMPTKRKKGWFERVRGEITEYDVNIRKLMSIKDRLDIVFSRLGYCFYLCVVKANNSFR